MENVKPKERIPGSSVYLAAWVDDNDVLNFRDDIYFRDKTQIKQIEKKEKQMVSSNNPDNKRKK